MSEITDFKMKSSIIRFINSTIDNEEEKYDEKFVVSISEDVVDRGMCNTCEYSSSGFMVEYLFNGEKKKEFHDVLLVDILNWVYHGCPPSEVRLDNEEHKRFIISELLNNKEEHKKIDFSRFNEKSVDWGSSSISISFVMGIVCVELEIVDIPTIEQPQGGYYLCSSGETEQRITDYLIEKSLLKIP